MADLLDMQKINSLPHPLFARQYGDRDIWWPIDTIEVQTGLTRLDICGKFQIVHYGAIAEIKDDAGVIYPTDDFYVGGNNAEPA